MVFKATTPTSTVNRLPGLSAPLTRPLPPHTPMTPPPALSQTTLPGPYSRMHQTSSSPTRDSGNSIQTTVPRSLELLDRLELVSLKSKPSLAEQIGYTSGRRLFAGRTHIHLGELLVDFRSPRRSAYHQVCYKNERLSKQRRSPRRSVLAQYSWIRLGIQSCPDV